MSRTPIRVTLSFDFHPDGLATNFRLVIDKVHDFDRAGKLAILSHIRAFAETCSKRVLSEPDPTAHHLGSSSDVIRTS